MPHATARIAAPRTRGFALVLLAAGVASACGTSASPRASAVASDPSSVPVPSISTASAGPSSQGVNPDPDAGAAVDAFRAFVQTEQSFHLAGDMLMTVGDLTLQAAIVSDVQHGDEQGTIDLRGPGVSVRVSVVLLDGTAYMGLARREWQTIPAQGAFSNPLAGLDVEGLEPIDIVNVGGVETHHLRVEDPDALNGQTLSGNTLTDLTIDSSSLDVYITDDGVPLAAIAEFAGTGSFGGEVGPVTARIRYDLSNFGQELEIVAPSVAPSAGP
jgi:hypothetical protein